MSLKSITIRPKIAVQWKEICPNCQTRTLYKLEWKGTVPTHRTCDTCRCLWWEGDELVPTRLPQTDQPPLL